MIDQTGELIPLGVTVDPEQADSALQEGTGNRARLGMAALALIPIGLLFFLYLRVADTQAVNSDGANNALQAWDMLHGHLLLHNWVIGDATYYTFELPLFALCEAVFGLGSVAVHVADAIVYLSVAAMAALLACRGARGRTAVVRCGIVAAMLGVPISVSTVIVMLYAPDHIGTCAILLGAIYLTEAASDGAVGRRRYLPVWLGVVLTLGQLGDQTVLYVGTLSILVISGYRMALRRGVRNLDGALFLAAALSYPAALLLRELTRLLGGYTMVPPLTTISPMSLWWTNAKYTWGNLGQIFGINPGSVVNSPVAGLATVLGSIGAVATVLGFVLVVARWRTVGRGPQILCIAILANLGTYIVSSIPNQGNAREVVFTLPAGAVLAAWAWPGRIPDRRWIAVPMAAVLAAAAFIPASVVAAQPIANPRDAVLATWLKAHGLTYGIGGYWDSSSVAVESNNAVDVRAVWLYQGRFLGYSWEARSDWYDPATHYADFYIAQEGSPALVITPAEVEQVYGPPAATYVVATRVILVYHKNLLDQVKPLVPGTG